MAKKQKNIKKQTKTNKGKFGLRKLDFKKNWKKLSYLGLAGFLTLTSVGYAGWNYFNEDDASALSYTSEGVRLYNKSSSLTLCKYASKTSTTTIKVRARKINSGYETFKVNTWGDDFYWTSATSGSYYEKKLNNVGTSSEITFGIATSTFSTAGNYFVQYMPGCQS
jgi:hypothetical protein